MLLRNTGPILVRADNRGRRVCVDSSRHELDVDQRHGHGHGHGERRER